MRTETARQWMLNMFINHNPSNDWITKSDAIQFCIDNPPPKEWDTTVLDRVLFRNKIRTFNPNQNPILEENASGDESSYRLFDESIINHPPSHAKRM